MDLTFKIYKKLLSTLQSHGFSFQTLEEFIQSPNERVVIIRHDVDSWPSNALQMAKIEKKNAIKATYYFRLHPMSFHHNVIQKIVKSGHEIGYHYEDLANTKGNVEKAFETFQQNLSKLRKFYPVKTISMHGRPLSKWDSKDIWKQYDYKKLGLICEPYLDIDYNKVLYLTDTGGCWDGDKFSVRDKVKSTFEFHIHTTNDLIVHVKKNLLPNQIILNIHPARWNDNIIKWCIRQFILTYPKRGIKQMIKRFRDKK